jgi:hypothetical protein
MAVEEFFNVGSKEKDLQGADVSNNRFHTRKLWCRLTDEELKAVPHRKPFIGPSKPSVAV